MVSKQTGSVANMIQAGDKGADTGFIGFSYNDDMVKWFDENVSDLEEYWTEQAENLGCDSYIEMLMGSRRKDMLSLGVDGVKVLIAWASLETVGQELIEKFDAFKELEVGDEVSVEDEDDCSDFIGGFVGIKESDNTIYIQVRDSEDNVFDVDLINATIEE